MYLGLLVQPQLVMRTVHGKNNRSERSMFLLGFRPRHALPTANEAAESREGRFRRQIDGTMPAVSPKATSAHPFSILRRCTILFTHFTVHGEAFLLRTVLRCVRLSYRPCATRGKHKFCILRSLSRCHYAAQRRIAPSERTFNPPFPASVSVYFQKFRLICRHKGIIVFAKV